LVSLFIDPLLAWIQEQNSEPYVVEETDNRDTAQRVEVKGGAFADDLMLISSGKQGIEADWKRLVQL